MWAGWVGGFRVYLQPACVWIGCGGSAVCAVCAAYAVGMGSVRG